MSAARADPLAQHGDHAVEDRDGDDEDADEWLVCVFHTLLMFFQRSYGTSRAGVRMWEMGWARFHSFSLNSGLYRDNGGSRLLSMPVHFLMCEKAGEAAGGIAKQRKAQLGAAIDDRLVAVPSQAREAGVFEDADPRVFGVHMVGGGDDLVDPGMIEQAADAGLEARQVHGIIKGGIKTIDTYGATFADVSRHQVHLDGWMDLEEEERAIQVGDQISTEDFFFVGFHAVVDFPKSFVGIKLQGGSIKFFTKDLPDECTVRVFTYRADAKIPVQWIEG
jgi:hypothetical protein